LKRSIRTTLKPEELEALIIQSLETELTDKEAQVGQDNLNMFIRMQYLQAIDRKWLDHLENMEASGKRCICAVMGRKIR